MRRPHRRRQRSLRAAAADRRWSGRRSGAARPRSPRRLPTGATRAAAPGRRPPRRRGTSTSPSGLPRSQAILAASFTSAMPAETASPHSSRTARLMATAMSRPGAVEGAAAGHVQEGLVQRQRLDQRRVPAVDAEDVLRDPAVALEARREEDALRAQPARPGGRHGGAHAEPPGLVARRAHHAAPGRPPRSPACPGARDRRAAPPTRRTRRGRGGGWFAPLESRIPLAPPPRDLPHRSHQRPRRGTSGT